MRSLERLWVRYQLDVAALRPALGPLYNAAGEGRRAHTFFVGQEPPDLGFSAAMGPTVEHPNGVPDIFAMITGGSYSGRIVSVAAASAILILLDSAIQEFARALRADSGADMDAGDDIAAADVATPPVKASTFIWAGANNVRHIAEWSTSASTFLNPKTAEDRRLRERQENSMAPLAAVLGCGLPITENVAYEVFHYLVMLDETHGSFDRLERHVLCIGQDLAQRAGLAGAPIGVTLTEVVPTATIKAGYPPGDLLMSDGIARAASSIEVAHRVLNVRPLSG